MTPVAVTGAGVVAPTGAGIPALWGGLLHDRAARVAVPYPAARGHLAGVVPPAGQAAMTSPGRLVDLGEQAATEALAGLDAGRRASTILVLGTTDTGGNALSAALADPGAPVDATLPGLVGDLLAQRLGLAEAVTIGSASAAGAVAIGFAMEMLRAGDATDVLVVGADTVSETAFSGLAALRTLAVDGCRPFNATRRGIGLAECAVACLLHACAGAGRPPVAAGCPAGWLRGYGASSHTRHLVAPEPDGIEIAVRRALDDAGITPDEVSFVNAHGPGTRRGDAAELEALAAVFGDRLPTTPLTSSKGTLWHCQGGAGIIESLACLLSLQHQVITPTAGCEPVDPRWRDLDIVTAPRAVPALRTALSISCGLGGVNTAIVWERLT